MRGITTHSYAVKSNTDWTTALKKNLDTCCLDPSLIRILDILHQTAHDFVRVCIKSGQSSSDANITLPMYLKYRTIVQMPTNGG